MSKNVAILIRKLMKESEKRHSSSFEEVIEKYEKLCKKSEEKEVIDLHNIELYEDFLSDTRTHSLCVRIGIERRSSTEEWYWCVLKKLMLKERRGRARENSFFPRKKSYRNKQLSRCKSSLNSSSNEKNHHSVSSSGLKDSILENAGVNKGQNRETITKFIDTRSRNKTLKTSKPFNVCSTENSNELLRIRDCSVVLKKMDFNLLDNTVIVINTSTNSCETLQTLCSKFLYKHSETRKFSVDSSLYDKKSVKRIDNQSTATEMEREPDKTRKEVNIPKKQLSAGRQDDKNISKSIEEILSESTSIYTEKDTSISCNFFKNEKCSDVLKKENPKITSLSFYEREISDHTDKDSAIYISSDKISTTSATLPSGMPSCKKSIAHISTFLFSATDDSKTSNISKNVDSFTRKADESNVISDHYMSGKKDLCTNSMSTTIKQSKIILQKSDNKNKQLKIVEKKELGNLRKQKETTSVEQGRKKVHKVLNLPFFSRNNQNPILNDRSKIVLQLKSPYRYYQNIPVSQQNLTHTRPQPITKKNEVVEKLKIKTIIPTQCVYIDSPHSNKDNKDFLYIRNQSSISTDDTVNLNICNGDNICETSDLVTTTCPLSSGICIEKKIHKKLFKNFSVSKNSLGEKNHSESTQKAVTTKPFTIIGGYKERCESKVVTPGYILNQHLFSDDCYEKKNNFCTIKCTK